MHGTTYMYININNLYGRHDWIRTNDLFRVKVSRLSNSTTYKTPMAIKVPVSTNCFAFSVSQNVSCLCQSAHLYLRNFDRFQPPTNPQTTILYSRILNIE